MQPVVLRKFASTTGNEGSEATSRSTGDPGDTKARKAILV